MDEASDQIQGEYYPYSYNTHNSFLKKVLSDSPKMLGYFVSFPEPSSDESNFYYDFVGQLTDYSKKGIFRIGTGLDYWGEQLPVESIKELGFSLALINVDGEDFAKDSVHRKALLNISGDDSFHLWSANALRTKDGLEPIEAKFIKGSYYDTEVDATFAYYQHPVNLSKVSEYVEEIPFYRVLNGNIPNGFFEDKVVLIGPQYLSNVDDFVLTPFSKDLKVSKLAIHASMIKAFMNNDGIYAIPSWIIDIISLLMAISLSFLISKVKPSRGLLITSAILTGTLLFSGLTFVLFGVWIKIVHPLMSVFIVYYIWIPFRAMAEYQTRFAIEEETAMLKKVEHLKQNFISLMSHDLKTPVAKIAGMADILKLKIGSENDALKSIADGILNATKELNQFITSILDLTKIESKNLQINFITKDVNKILESSIHKLEFEAESKKISVIADLAPLYPIELDPVLIDRVLSNLIENAIKYSPVGSTINIKSYDDDKWVNVEIIDNGPGIDAESLNHIFDKFYRVKNDSVHKIKGSGLGLYLVKYFIELHKGEISVESELEAGTKFKVKLINK